MSPDLYGRGRPPVRAEILTALLVLAILATALLSTDSVGRPDLLPDLAAFVAVAAVFGVRLGPHSLLLPIRGTGTGRPPYTLLLPPPSAPMRPTPTKLFLLLALTALSGCDLAGDVLEFGFWTGVIALAALVAVVWFALKAFQR